MSHILPLNWTIISLLGTHRCQVWYVNNTKTYSKENSLSVSEPTLSVDVCGMPIVSLLVSKVSSMHVRSIFWQICFLLLDRQSRKLCNAICIPCSRWWCTWLWCVVSAISAQSHSQESLVYPSMSDMHKIPIIPVLNQSICLYVNKIPCIVG